MTIRPLRPDDIPRLREIEGHHRWEFGEDFMDALVMADEDDRPVLCAGAWRLAEVHCLVDPAWKTPGAREAALKTLHRAMEIQVKAHSVRRVVTWFAGTERFCRRLLGWGWLRSSEISYIKVLR
jgi:hypothetical protein